MRQRVLAELRAIRARLEALEQLLAQPQPVPAVRPNHARDASLATAAPVNGQHWRKLPAQASRGRGPARRRPAAARRRPQSSSTRRARSCAPVLRVPELPLHLSSGRDGGAAMRVLDVAQRSPAWRQARAGRLTASRAHDMLTCGRGPAEAVTRSAYRRQLIVERLTGRPAPDGFVSAAMVRGRRPRVGRACGLCRPHRPGGADVRLSAARRARGRLFARRPRRRVRGRRRDQSPQHADASALPRHAHGAGRLSRSDPTSPLDHRRGLG